VLASELRFTPKQIVEVAFQGIAESFLSDRGEAPPAHAFHGRA
jgi:hypothetical protein